MMEMQVEAVGRPAVLPPGASCYRRIGPFDEETLPKGLLAEHRLKEDVWGLLHITSGAVTFVWDDERGGETRLIAPAQMVIPPAVPHHLVLDGPVSIEIEFHRQADER
jgi:tellurite resistance-related uncharacterized protein